jgi:hypothetical protein
MTTGTRPRAFRAAILAARASPGTDSLLDRRGMSFAFPMRGGCAALTYLTEYMV